MLLPSRLGLSISLWFRVDGGDFNLRNVLHASIFARTDELVGQLRKRPVRTCYHRRDSNLTEFQLTIPTTLVA